MANYYAPRYQIDASPYDAGYESSSDTSNTPWEAFAEEFVPASNNYAYSINSMSPSSTGAPNTPAMAAVRPSTSRTPSSSSIKKASSSSHPTSAPETEEERRKNRKREQNRESQRAFRRRQEGRVKFLENKTLELETCSRALKAENDALRVALLDERNRNQNLVETMNSLSLMSPSPLSIADHVVPSVESHSQHQQQQHGMRHYTSDMDPRVVW